MKKIKLRDTSALTAREMKSIYGGKKKDSGFLFDCICMGALEGAISGSIRIDEFPYTNSSTTSAANAVRLQYCSKYLSVECELHSGKTK